MPQLAPSTRLAAALLLLVSAAVACTGDDDDGAAAPSGPATSSTPATTAATPSTKPPSSTAAPTTTVAPLPPVSATRVPLEDFTDAGPSAYAGTLLPAASGRGFLLIGGRQERAGERWVATLWESGNAENWDELPASPAFGEGTSTNAVAGAWSGQELVIGGSVEDEQVDARPAVWSAPDGWNFGPSTDPFGMPGTVSALTPGPAGLLAGGAAAPSVDEEESATVALRTDSGWTSTRLASTGGTTAWLGGLAATATTVVAVGSIDTGDISQAAVWVSADGGRTFTAADLSSLHTPMGSHLGSVVPTSTGFAALACTANGDVPTTVLMTTADGITWQRVEIVATDADGTVFPVVDWACSRLQTDGDRLLAGSLDLGTGYVLAIGHDGRGEYLIAPRGAGRAADSAPFAVRRTDGLVGVVSVEERGFSAGLADVLRPTGTGLPIGRPALSSLGVVALADRLLADGVRYPFVNEGGNGAYSIEGLPVWASSVRGMSWARAGADVVPQDARFVRSANGIDVAFGGAADPADQDGEGPVGGAAAWVRGAGEAWQSVGLIASGPGGDVVYDALATPSGFLTVGTASTRNATGVTTTAAIAASSADGRTWVAETIPPAGGHTELDRVCPLPDDAALAVGSTLIGGEDVPYLLRRESAGVWSEVDRSEFEPDLPIYDCEIIHESAVLISRNESGETLVYRTNDGVSFESTVLDQPESSATEIRATVVSGPWLYGAGGVAIDESPVDGGLWRSTDGITWERIAIAGADGQGDQYVSDIAASASGELVMIGFDRGLPVTWTVSPP